MNRTVANFLLTINCYSYICVGRETVRMIIKILKHLIRRVLSVTVVVFQDGCQYTMLNLMPLRQFDS